MLTAAASDAPTPRLPLASAWMGAALVSGAWVLKGVYVTADLPEVRYGTAATATLAFGLAVGAGVVWLRPRQALATAVLLNVAASVLLFMDRLHWRFFEEPTSVVELSDAWQLGSVADAILARLDVSDAALVLDLMVVATLLVACRRRHAQVGSARLPQRRALSLALGLAALAFVAPTVTTVAVDRDHVFEWRASRSAMAGVLGIIPYHAYDLATNLALRWQRWEIRPADIRAAAELVRDRAVRRQQSLPSFGLASGADVIVVQAESLQDFVVGLRVNGRAVTPHLDAFAKESVRFTNFHEQTWLGATSDAMFIALHSLHPLPPSQGAVATRGLTNSYHGLPSVLARHRYSTFAAMGAPGKIWHIDRLWRQLGFQQTAYESSYPGTARFGQGVADEPFFLLTASMLTALPRPFLGFLVSVSAHSPYNLPPAEQRLQLGDLSGTMLGRYLDSVHYFDRAFGGFLGELRRLGLLDSSLIVVYGDHEAWLEPSEALSRLTEPSADAGFSDWRARKRVPLLVRLPGGQRSGDVDVPAGQIDLAPTILGLLGIREPQVVMLGTDLFQQAARAVAFRDGSVAAERRYARRHALGTTCYEADSGRVMECGVLSGALAAARHELSVSDHVLFGNLVPTLLSLLNGNPLAATRGDDPRR